MCLQAKSTAPKALLASDNTIGVRIPEFAWLLELLKIIDCPLLSPSANFGGEPAPRKLAEIDKNLIKLVDYVVAIEPEGKEPSTIVKIENDRVKVIREGDIKKGQIEQRLKGV
jgi:L-threonylcarbamoyladenylate synthase